MSQESHLSESSSSKSDTERARELLRSAGYTEYPTGLESSWAESSWERRIEGVPEYSRGEGKFFIRVHISDRSLPGAHTFTVEAFGETGDDANAHSIEAYGLRVAGMADSLRPAERRVIAAWTAVVGAS